MEIIGLENTKKWDETVRATGNYDFYHLSACHLLYDFGKPVLISHSKNGQSCALPLIIRKIEGSDYCDATSVYGYAGAIISQEAVDNEFITDFQQNLRQFFDENRIVTAFSRLHPLLPAGNALLGGLGKIKKENLTVAIDLKQPESEQFAQYTHSLKQALVLLEKENVSVREAKNSADIEAFIEIYYENMKRVGAAPFYFFPKEYFLKFLATIPSFLLVAEKDGKIIAGSLNSRCNGIIQTHLAATKTEFLDISPLKAVWSNVREYGARKGFRYVHFGGGLSGRNDTLFLFKAHFSDLRFQFSTWRYIHNEKAFKELNLLKFGKIIPETGFFPPYRD
ncbi:MAG: GNAT family N-acetyltransferase [Dysgonamonadaceae bacterium]|jgi:hypothetical protein|nr:GNAT family N-acetyltransferase [Dysgonamonadaceae bacterium]